LKALAQARCEVRHDLDGARQLHGIPRAQRSCAKVQSDTVLTYAEEQFVQ
jgi:hypothetical protein